MVIIFIKKRNENNEQIRRCKKKDKSIFKIMGLGM